MLTIRRVPTVLSWNQEDGSDGPECIGSCCSPGSKMPLYSFQRCAAEDAVAPEGSELNESLLGTFLLSQWEERANQGLFKYDVTACESKVLPGKWGFMAQLNEGRLLKKRATEFRVDQVLQLFDPSKFNFTKASQKEVLFCFEEAGNGRRAGYYAASAVPDSPNIVVINESPIEYGHVLLVPRVLGCLPQRIEAETLLVALHFAVEADSPYFRVGYNSLGAFATINHLHFQAYYLACPFPVERAQTARINKKRSKLKISQLVDYPVKGLVYENGKLDDTARSVANACKKLQEKNIPFNILISGCGSRVFLFPQCFAGRQARNEVDQEMLDTQVNPAVWEISGHMVLKRKEDYEQAREGYALKLLAEVSLNEAEFDTVKQICLEAGK